MARIAKFFVPLYSHQQKKTIAVAVETVPAVIGTIAIDEIAANVVVIVPSAVAAMAVTFVVVVEVINVAVNVVELVQQSTQLVQRTKQLG